ncbi:MAG TPA: NAD-dependent epimerase/dehydratase family protein [Chloroflexia bacterium]|nr:NAD-dependent epimerase/dehydratase family protein [Chloroflexia bacterium]
MTDFRPQILILGCGYTGERVARRLLAQGQRVVATSRQPEQLADLQVAGATILPLDLAVLATLSALENYIEPGCLVLHSIPPLKLPDGTLQDHTPALLQALGDKPSRMVYLSTTAVYGSAKFVDEKTPAAPRNQREQVRVEAEQAVMAGPWRSLILRPAGIYGPGRNVAASMLAGRYRLTGDGSNYVSRIHVDDLAAHCVAALLQPDVCGAYPVADDLPATSLEVASFCAELLNLPVPASVTPEEAPPTRQGDRRVDGCAIRASLGLTLAYPSYRQGIPAALAPTPS